MEGVLSKRGLGGMSMSLSSRTSIKIQKTDEAVIKTASFLAKKYIISRYIDKKPFTKTKKYVKIIKTQQRFVRDLPMEEYQ